MKFDDYKITDLHIFMENENYKLVFIATFFLNKKVIYQKQFSSSFDGISKLIDVDNTLSDMLQKLFGELDSIIDTDNTH